MLHSVDLDLNFNPHALSCQLEYTSGVVLIIVNLALKATVISSPYTKTPCKGDVVQRAAGIVHVGARKTKFNKTWSLRYCTDMAIDLRLVL